MNMNTKITHIKNAIELSLIDKLPIEIYNIDGMSSNKVRNLLNNICNLEGYNYLEIGTWKGSTFVSSLHNNRFNKAYVIDNWSEFGNAKNDFNVNIKKYLNNRINDIKIMEEDCFSLSLTEINNKIDIYFYDGNHKYESQKKALTYYYETLSDEFIFIVDDWNYGPVPLGTNDAINELNLKIKFKTILSSRHNGDKDNYWNGIGVFLLEK